MAGLVVALGATACLAETPDFSSERPQAMSLFNRGPLFSGPNWWNRYGEAVNAPAMAQAEASPSDKMGPAAAMPVYGDGYVFAPGSCDCPPPCISDLWTGYFQNPLRCHPGHWLHRHGGCGNCGHCGRCAKACGVSCAAPAPSCACAAPVTCTTAAPSCGCKPVCGKCRNCHLGKWRGFAAHWTKSCDSCAAPLGCGCTTPVAPYSGSEKQAADRIPMPLPEEAVLYSLPRLN
jgi:hypothetical protein